MFMRTSLHKSIDMSAMYVRLTQRQLAAAIQAWLGMLHTLGQSQMLRRIGRYRLRVIKALEQSVSARSSAIEGELLFRKGAMHTRNMHAHTYIRTQWSEQRSRSSRSG